MMTPKYFAVGTLSSFILILYKLDNSYIFPLCKGVMLGLKLSIMLASLG